MRIFGCLLIKGTSNSIGAVRPATPAIGGCATAVRETGAHYIGSDIQRLGAFGGSWQRFNWIVDNGASRPKCYGEHGNY